MKFIAYEGDCRLTAPADHEACEQAIADARHLAGAMAKRRRYRIVAATKMDLARMMPHSSCDEPGDDDVF